MALNALVHSFVPQSEKCATERVNTQHDIKRYRISNFILFLFLLIYYLFKSNVHDGRHLMICLMHSRFPQYTPFSKTTPSYFSNNVVTGEPIGIILAKI